MPKSTTSTSTMARSRKGVQRSVRGVVLGMTRKGFTERATRAASCSDDGAKWMGVRAGGQFVGGAQSLLEPSKCGPHGSVSPWVSPRA